MFNDEFGHFITFGIQPFVHHDARDAMGPSATADTCRIAVMITGLVQ